MPSDERTVRDLLVLTTSPTALRSSVYVIFRSLRAQVVLDLERALTNLPERRALRQRPHDRRLPLADQPKLGRVLRMASDPEGSCGGTMRQIQTMRSSSMMWWGRPVPPVEPLPSIALKRNRS